jgi:hypothetical protein
MTQEPKPLPSRRWEMTSQEQDMMDRFRRDFLELLDGRVAKIEKLVLTGQLEPAHVALLSLESSSAMVGRTELAGADELDTLLAQLLQDAETARRQLEGTAS